MALPVGTKVIIKKVPSPMYESAIGREAKAGAHTGVVSGYQQFLYEEGTKPLYLPEDHVEVVGLQPRLITPAAPKGGYAG